MKEVVGEYQSSDGLILGILCDPYTWEQLEEVVHCRDCEHAFEKDNGMYSCHGDLTEPWDYYNDCPNITLVPADGFCFCGKRREDG